MPHENTISSIQLVISGGNVTRLSTTLRGKKVVPRQKAARKAILEGLTTKAADLTKDNPANAKKIPKKKEDKARPVILSISCEA